MKNGRSKFTVRFTQLTTYKRFNNETDQLFLHCEEKEGRTSTTGGLTALEAAWNVTNAIQVDLPYSVYHGGYWSLLAMMGVAWICTYTGQILISCLYEPSPSTGLLTKVRYSYVEIAEHVWGKRVGGPILFIAQNIELLMTCILYLVLCGELLAGSFPQFHIPVRYWICISCIFTLPYSFIRSLRLVSRFSAEAWKWDWSKIQFRINIASFPTSLGIIVFSYTSQIFLPTLENNMRYPHQFNAMLALSHIIAAIFKTGFALIGFLTWQEQTSEVITNNLPTQQLRIIINLTLAIKALLSYPLPYFAACELILPKFSLSNEMTTWKTILARIILILSTLIMALCIPHFAQLMGLIGSITGVFLSLVWPCYFYLHLKSYLLSWTTICGNLAIIIFGFMCTISGIIDASRELAKKF
ncbi:unnamed protein product [Rotaria magnacalcarata]|uniref:Amino acid transporter transmembrane domain-containing protein n=2 Tax=Rotaria magnacalcarata TaxID=392030 RepID=A0A819RQP7_9BILA|nr:unnamed protein product [Rotaria magnacalcarata]CAF4092948.1 unnamed protein product [Rotaria magnacalcarata]